MSNVTFHCDCPDAVVAVTIQRATEPSDVGVMAFRRSGKKAIRLTAGTHWMSYRAVGEPRSDLSIKVTGGVMRAVTSTLGADGRAGGIRKVVVAALIAAASLIGPTTAGAQTARDAAKRDAKATLVALPAVAPPSVPGVSLSVEANATDRRGALAMVFGRATDDRFTAGLTISGPLNDSSGSAQPLDLNGLNTGAAIDVGLHWFLWRGRADLAAATAMCAARFKRTDCDDRDFADANERRAYLKALGADVDPIVIDVTGSVSRSQFSYLEKITFNAGSQSHNDAAAGIAIGRLSPRVGLVSGGVAMARDWRAGSSAREICQPIEGGPSFECRTAPIGPPVAATRPLVTLEWRRFLIRHKAA
ncbi:MAG: hypothetical protein EPO35_11405, partial [Acidobacteria bacterium]